MQGLILLNKPAGITSAGAVARIRRITGEKRVGHTGTLDPMATGVLPVLLGRATALSGLMLDADKRYTAGIKLGVSTDTEDITGSIVSEKPVTVTAAETEAALKAFTGKISQRPPVYSALKKDGVRLYELARRGEAPELKCREVEIFSLSLVSAPDRDNVFTVDAHVSKGTYIRSLARDIGEYLGCGACLYSLTRTYAGGFSLADCVNPDELNADNVGMFIKSEEEAVRHLRGVTVTPKQAARFCNGGQLDFERLKIEKITDGELFRVKCGGVFLGIGRTNSERSQLAVKCVINYPEGTEK